MSAAYGLRYVRIGDTTEVERGIREVLAFPGPVVCEVMCQRDQEIIPAVASARQPDGSMKSRPLEDMYPFLSREELHQLMIVKPLK